MNPVPIVKNKEFIKFCNQQRCILCGAQLDGNISFKYARLYCVRNAEEYTVGFEFNNPNPVHEIINHYFSNFQYEIRIDGYGSTANSAITQLDLSYKQKQRSRKLIFQIDSRLTFFRKPLTEKQFLDKLKLYNVFS